MLFLFDNYLKYQIYLGSYSRAKAFVFYQKVVNAYRGIILSASYLPEHHWSQIRT